MKYRSRSEITYMILNSVNAHVTKTRIMYEAYLSYTQLKEYLAHMETNGLIKCETTSQRYHITEKGRKLLHLYEKVGEMVFQNTPSEIAKTTI